MNLKDSKGIFSTRFECIFASSPPVSSVVLGLFLPLLVELQLRNWPLYTLLILMITCSMVQVQNYTRFECSFTSFLLVSSVVSHLFHPFRV
jgi:hypothetical protein